MDKPSVKSVAQIVLQAMVIVFAVIFLLLKWIKVGGDSDNYGSEALEVQGAERNERSTPRSFILPATPGVAFEQERQKYDRGKQAQLAKCAGTLRNLGYQFSNSETLLNAKIVEAIFEFQVEHNLPATGRLDQATMRAMKCS